jgi:hypothetical protein
VALLIAVAGLACAPTKGVPRPDVVLWGDSFGEQVAPYLPYEERVFGGLHPCLVEENVVTNPAPPIAVFLFVGSEFAPPGNCNYQPAVDRITANLVGRGSRVIWLAALCDPHGRTNHHAVTATYPNPVHGPANSIGCDPNFREPDGHLTEVGKQRVANQILAAVG